MCIQTVGQGHLNKLYEHVHILRCDPLMIQDANSAKEYLTVKLKMFLFCNFQMNSNVTNL